MGLITNELNNLKEADLWSFLLFALFKTKEVPELSTLSELAYILDKPNLLKLCSIFGGSTITIPTIDELETLIYSLLVYNYIDIEKYSFEEAISKLNNEYVNTKVIKANYLKIREVLQNYTFTSRSKL